MGKRDGFTAQESVIPSAERKAAMETDEYIRQIVRYRIAMSMARSMLDKGIITPEEYAKIDTIMAKKAGISSCTIFSDNP